MTISPVGISEADFRAILTSPFLIKEVSINSHTPYDEPNVEQKTFSKDDLPGPDAVYTGRLKVHPPNVGVIDYSKKSADIVKEMINDGYSATNAIDFQKAIKAYGFNAINSSGVANISNSQT